MTALALCGEKIAGTRPRVDSSRLDNNARVLDQLLDVCPRVGIANLRLLGGVEPDFTLADTGDRGGEPLLGAKVDHDG